MRTTACRPTKNGGLQAFVAKMRHAKQQLEITCDPQKMVRKKTAKFEHMIDDQFVEDQSVVAVQRGDGGTEPHSHSIHVYLRAMQYIHLKTSPCWWEKPIQ